MLKSFIKHRWRRVLACLLAVLTVISLLPVTAMAADGDTGGLNPGSPGGQKPGSTDVAWATDPEQTFLRFTLVEFPNGVVNDLNTNDGSVWQAVGTPLNVVWVSAAHPHDGDHYRSRVTWYDSNAMLFNGAGNNAAQLMGSSVTAYSAASGNNRRRVITADEFQAATGISDQQKDQMFHLNSSSWSTGWLNGDYTSMWGTDPHPVTSGNLYNVYKANDAFVYLLTRLSETGGEGTGWSAEDALSKWADFVYDASGSLRTKYRIIIETGGIFTDPDGIRRAYTLREMMAYSLYNNEETDVQYNLIWDQATTMRNMAQWMRQAKEQFVEYPLDAAGTPTGEELYSTNGFQEADSIVDSIRTARQLRSTIFSERRSYGLHILNPFNFESEINRLVLEVTKQIRGSIPADQTFGFTVAYTAGSPSGFTATKNGTDCAGEVTETGSGLKFSLKGGETVRIVFEADNTFRCEVREDDPTLLTGISGTGGTADSTAGRFTTTGNDASVTFVNEKPDVPPPSANLEVTKTIGGAIPADQTFGFTVTYTAGTPTGFTATKNGADCTGEVTATDSGLKFTLKGGETVRITFVADDSFRCQVREDDPSLLTGITGTGGTADTAGNKFTTTGSSASVTFTNVYDPPPPPAKTILYKRDAITNAGVGPATFRFASVTNGVYEFNTNANGELEAIQWWDPTEAAGRYIKPGEYTVTELIPPPNYTISDEVKLIRLALDAYGDPIPAGPLVFTNLAKPGLRIVKYDRQSHRPMSGVTFDLYRDGAFVGRYETDAGGEIFLRDIEPGTYRAVEVDTGDNVHILDTSWQEVELDAGGGVRDLVFFNDVLPGMKLIKVDASDLAKAIPGAVFEIKSVAGDYGPVEFTTDNNGEIDLSSLPTGSYVVTELECPGYVIDSAQRIIHLRANDTAEFVFTNTRRPSLRLVKTSADGSPLDGVTFSITLLEDASRSLDRATQNGGEILIEGLEPGIYRVVETATLPDHILDETEYFVELSPGRTTELHVSNDKKPDLTIRKTDKDTGAPVPGVTFTLRRADGSTITTEATGLDGTVTVSHLLPGVYTVTEQSVPEDYILDPATQTVTLFPNRDATVQFQNYQRPTLKIVKVDSAGKPLTGAVFEVKTKAGVKIGDFPVGADGTVTVPCAQLDEGYYIITEIQAPEGYILDAMPREVYLRPGKATEITIVNEKKPGLTIKKVDSVTGEAIEGVKFQVWRGSDNTTTGDYYDLGVFYTDTEGLIHLEQLDTGWYKVKELEPASGYIIKQPDTQEIYLAAGQDRTLVFENTPKSKIIVQKYDSVTHEPLPGCLFQLRQFSGISGTEGTVISRKVTGEDGTITWTGLTPGAYIVQEVDAADGYNITNASETVYLADDGEQNTVTLLFTNDPDGSLLIRKVCSVNPSVTLQNAEFKVLYADGSVVGNSNGIYRTDENGEIFITGLTPGKSVVVTEIRAPDGFILDTQSQTIQIKAGQIMTVTFKNQPRGSLIIQKRDSQTGEALPGAEFRITTAAGCEVGLDGVIGTSTLTSNGIFTTDAQGEIRISNLAPGAYVITEIKAPDGYVIDTPSTNVVIGTNGDVQTVVIKDTKKGALIIEKYDSVTKQPLKDAQFKVTTASGELVADNEGLTSSNGLYTTDASGQIVLSRLHPGVYVVTETTAPYNYQKDPIPQTVVVYAGDTQTIRFYNDPLCTLTILKRNAVTKQPLQGAEFTVRDSEGRNIGRYTTGSDGTVTVTGLTPNATIVVSESKAPAGYVLDETPQHIVVRSGAVNVLTFDDQPTATLIIHKYIEGTNNEPLAGVAFKVVDGSGTPVGTGDGTFYTDTAGEIVIEGLEPGATITAWEIKTVEGYVLDGSPKSARLQAGKASELTFWNKQAGTLVIQKKDSVSGELIPGAQFQLTYANGGYVDQDNGHLSSNGIYTTDDKGEIRISGIVGTVVAKEIQPAPGYVIDADTQTQTVTVNPMDTQTLVFLNDPLCSLTIKKLDSVTGKPVSGAVFEVRKGSTNILGNYTTGQYGTVTVTGLIPESTYMVTEVKVPDGYVLDSTPKVITVKNGANTLSSGVSTQGGPGSDNDLTFENDPKMTLTIRKYIEGTNYEPLAGVCFKVTDSRGAAIGPGNGEFYTNAAGEIVIENLEPGTTVIAREIKTVDGFVLDGTPKSVVIEAGKTAPELIFWNKRAGTLVIQKKDSVTGALIPGAQFQLTYAEGGYVDADNGHLSSNGLYTTNAQGEIRISGIVGTVVVKEVQAAPGYVIDLATRTQTVTVNPMDTQMLVFMNDPLCSLTILKRDAMTGKPLQGAVFTVKDSEGKTIGVYTTGSDGTATVTGLIPNATIVVSESRAPSGYLLDNTPQNIVVRSGVANSLVFDDDPGTTLIIRKFIEGTENEPLSGVCFKVTDGNGGAVGPDDGVYFTDKAGEIVLEGIEPGTTVIAREIKTVDGFVLDGTPQAILIKSGSVQQLTFWNKKAGTLVIQKKDSVTGALIPGAQFQLTYANGGYVDQDNGHLSSNGLYTTDAQGEIRITGIVGTVVVKEVQAAPGYVIDPATQTQTVTVNPMDMQTITVLNEPLCTLTITKLDSVTGKPVPGTVFEIKDGSGNVLGRYTTGQDGTVTVTGLVPGTTVVVTEVKVPDGYVLNTTPRTITVTNGRNTLTGGRTNSGNTGNGAGNGLTFEDDPKMTLTIHKYIEGTSNEPLAGVAFKVTYGNGAAVGPSDGVFYTNAAGEIVIEGLEPGTTVIAREIKTVDGFVLDGTPKSVVIEAGKNAPELIFWNKRAGTLVIQKKDSVTGELIPGAQFQLTYASGGYVDADNGHLSSNGLYTTNAQGEIRISGIVGTIVVKEVQAAPGYVIDPATQSQTVTVNPMDTQTLVFMNDPLCSLTIMKRDAVTGRPLQGAEFTVRDGEGKTIGVYTTGPDGTVAVTGLTPNATIVVSESKAPAGYVLDSDPQSIVIRSGAANSLTFSDQPTVSLTIHKYIEGTNNEPLAGVVFKVTDGRGAPVGPGDGIYYTNAAGEIVINGLEPGDTVTVQEIKTVEGYVLDGTPKTVKITAGAQAPELVFWNAKAGELVIRKLDSVTKQPLAGVEFELTYAGGGYVDTANGHLSSNGLYTTNAHGEIHITGVTGTIVVKETRTIDGYTINEATRTQTVTVNPMDTQVLTFYNAPKQTLTIQKYVDGTTIPIQGVVFLVTDSGGAYLGPNNGEFVTDKNGQIIITDLTPGVTITAKEIRTVSGYVLDSTPQSILIKSGVSQTLTFFNRAKGGLELIKVSEADITRRIPGVTFEIRRMDGGLVTTVTTDSTGRVHVDLDAGNYYAVEIETARGFKLDSTPHYFTVQDGKITTLTVKNKPLSGILIHKTDSVTGQGLYGVTFLLYDSANTPIGQYTSDNSGYVYIEGLTVPGRYYLRELENAGYIPDTQLKTVYVQAGETTLIEWKNTPITAQIQVTKRSADYNPTNGLPAGTLLEGAVFELYDKAGNLVDTIRSDSRGVASSKPLPLGRYTIREVKAPDNYGISGEDLTAYLEHAGEIVRLEVTNKSLVTGVSIAKTGPNQVMAGQPVNYTFSGIANTGNVALTSFYWRDTLPAEVRLNTVVTGTYNFPGTYKIVYRVNGGEYRTLADNLSTQKNYTLAASAVALGLASNERVTEVMFVFGQAPAGFAQVEKPMLKCTAVSSITSTAFTNIADVGGVYNGQWVQAISRWVTTVYKPTVPTLPKTGY